jgi:hypothetical protein
VARRGLDWRQRDGAKDRNACKASSELAAALLLSACGLTLVHAEWLLM